MYAEHSREIIELMPLNIIQNIENAMCVTAIKDTIGPKIYCHWIRASFQTGYSPSPLLFLALKPAQILITLGH